MSDEFRQSAAGEQVLIRVDTLIRLRWYAIIGQAGAVLVVAFGFEYPMPWAICMLLIALSAALNVALMRQYRANHRLPGAGAFNLLIFDILQLGLLVFLTGGITNPFIILLMAPAVVSGASLPQNYTLVLGLLALAIISLLTFFHLPLPWDPAAPLDIPQLYQTGFWFAIICTLAFTGIYVFRVAEETRRLADALQATELVLQREQHLSALDGMAAAAAHELGTPLATIALVSKEMVHALPDDSPLHEDARLLRAQAQRCREILQKFSSLSSDNEPIIQRQPITSVVEKEVAPLREFGIDIVVHTRGSQQTTPIFNRNPGIQFGIGNLIDNAVEFAESSVVVVLDWDENSVSVEISDDGPGFPRPIIERIGEPFIGRKSRSNTRRKTGMGLGLFIAKTLLERSGAELSFANNSRAGLHKQGAFVRVSWPISIVQDTMKFEATRKSA